MKNRILVLSSYRTGSTSLCNVLSKQFKIKNYDEYFHKNKHQLDYNEIRANEYIIKIMPDQIKQPYFDDLSRHSKIYGIRRISVPNQIASYYISIKTNVWHKKFYKDDEYEITLDKEHLNMVTKSILKFNQDYNNIFRPLCHTEYIYEEIQNNLLNDSDYKIMNKPNNYEQIISYIQEIID